MVGSLYGGVLRDPRGIGRRQEVGKIVVMLSGELRWRGIRLDLVCADVSRNEFVCRYGNS